MPRPPSSCGPTPIPPCSPAGSVPTVRTSGSSTGTQPPAGAGALSAVLTARSTASTAASTRSARPGSSRRSSSTLNPRMSRWRRCGSRISATAALGCTSSRSSTASRVATSGWPAAWKSASKMATPSSTRSSRSRDERLFARESPGIWLGYVAVVPIAPSAGGCTNDHRSPGSRLDQLDRVGQVRDHAEELERLARARLVPVRRPRWDEHHVSRADVVDLVADPDPGAPAQHVLLVLDGVRVGRHAAARLHDESPQREVRSLVGADQDLPDRTGAGTHRVTLHVVRVSYRRPGFAHAPPFALIKQPDTLAARVVDVHGLPLAVEVDRGLPHLAHPHAGRLRAAE